MSDVDQLLAQPDAGQYAGASLDEQLALCAAQGWTDGLPVVPPTTERVQAMLHYWDRPLDQCIARLPPRYGELTPLRLAANAVMAGCAPEYFPLLALAIEAMCEPQFNLYAVQTTTHCVAPLVLVNGPIARELGIDGGHKAFGPGARANASIGRAIRLALMNVGGAIPGIGDMATYGSPAKFSFCIAENEAASPWAPLHEARGCEPGTSAVTVFACEGPHNVSDHASNTGKGILMTIAGTLATTGCNSVYHPTSEALVLISPEHAATLERDGWTRPQMQQFLWEQAQVPVRNFSVENIEVRLKGPKFGDRYHDATPDTRVPIAQSPEYFVIAVVGGAGKHSAVLPSFGNTTSVTRVLRTAQGRTVASMGSFIRD